MNWGLRGGLAALAVLGATRQAAALDCSTLPNRVYVSIADSQQTTIKTLARQLRSAASPLTVLYQTNSACTNVAQLVAGTASSAVFNYAPSPAESPTWDASQAALQCTPDAGGNAYSMVATDLFTSTCTPSAVPAGFTVLKGAVRPYVFATQLANTERAFTAEQAYFTFGFDDGGQASPWVDSQTLFIRTASRSIMRGLAADIQVPIGNWHGVAFDSLSQMTKALTDSQSPQSALGVLEAADYDLNRATLRALAFRGVKQRHAYYADSKLTTKDRQNVRDGHYLLWSQGAYIAANSDASAMYLANLLAGNAVSPTPAFEPLAAVVAGGSVPDCAMKVSRAVEGGELSNYTPAVPCGCYFQSQVGGLDASCKACNDANPCASGGHCRHGFCEAK